MLRPTSEVVSSDGLSFAKRCSPNRQLVSQKRWWESNPLRPGCSRLPGHLAPAFCAAAPLEAAASFVVFFVVEINRLDRCFGDFLGEARREGDSVVTFVNDKACWRGLEPQDPPT